MKLFNIKNLNIIDYAFGIILILIVILPSVELSNLRYASQTGKSLSFIGILTICTSMFLINLVFKKSLPIKINLLDCCLFIFFLYILINRYFIQDNYSYSLRFYELIGLGFVYLFVRVSPIRFIIFLFCSMCLGAILQSIIGNLQLFNLIPSNHHSFKITGSFFNPGPYSGYLTSIFPVSLGVYLFKDKVLEESDNQLNIRLASFVNSYIPQICIIAILLVLPATQSRAAWISVLICIAFLLLNRYEILDLITKKIKGFSKIAVSIIAILTFSIILISLSFFKKDSSEGRLLIYKVAFNIIRENPIFGNGFDSFKSVYMNFQSQYFRTIFESKEVALADNVNYAFNEYLQLTAENGIMGISFIALIIGLIMSVKNEKGRSILIICKSGLIGILVFAMFSYPMQILPIKLSVVLLTGVISNYSNRILLATYIALKSQRVIIVGVVLLIFPIVAILYYYMNTLYKGYNNWNTASLVYETGAYNESLKYFGSAHNTFTNDGDFLMQYGKALSMSNQNKKALAVLKKAEKYQNSIIVQTALGDTYQALRQNFSAEQAYLNAHFMVPNRFYPKYLLAKFYLKTNQKLKAVNTANELLSKSIKVQSPAVRQMISEMRIIVKKN